MDMMFFGVGPFRFLVRSISDFNWKIEDFVWHLEDVAESVRVVWNKRTYKRAAAEKILHLFLRLRKWNTHDVSDPVLFYSVFYFLDYVSDFFHFG